MNKLLTIYHGSEHIIKTPEFGKGKKNNDFGLGFYCTQSRELAKEWAVSSLRDGFCNRYTLDTEHLNILQLNSPNYTVLNWMAVLVAHRLFSANTPVARRAKAYLIDNFAINVNAYDLLIGYRADDSYFDFAEAFLSNSITVEQLSRAMRLGKLGEQIVLKSKFAFSKIKFEGAEKAEADKYYAYRKTRDDAASQSYLEILEEEAGGGALAGGLAAGGALAGGIAGQAAGAPLTDKPSLQNKPSLKDAPLTDNLLLDGLFMQDIMRGGITNENPRIPRNVS